MIAEVVSVLAESFEYGTAMTKLAHVLVPRFADWCVIDVISNQAVRPEAVAHTDPDREEKMRRDWLALAPSLLTYLPTELRVFFVPGSRSSIPRSP